MKIKSICALAIMLAASSIQAAAPDKCPDAAEIVKVGMSQEIIKILPSPGVMQITHRVDHAFGTDREWQLMMTVREAKKSGQHAYERAKNALESVYYVAGPKQLREGAYECGYYTKDNNVTLSLYTYDEMDLDELEIETELK